MSKKKVKEITQQQKDNAVEEFLSGAKSAEVLAREFNVSTRTIYKWKTLKEEKTKGDRIEQLVAQGNSKKSAVRILNLELENEEYKKKLAEEIIKVELLKKIHFPSPRENELTGLIKTTKKLDQRRRRVK